MNNTKLIQYYADNAALLELPSPEVTPRGILLLVHGMAEHKNRYIHVLQYFASHGYICAISDLRGHGERAKTEADFGFFGEKGHEKFVEDVHKIVCRLKQDFPGLPLILFGHSMGSLIVRAYTKAYDDTLNGLFVCGCPANNPAAPVGKLIIRTMAKAKGWHYRSKMVEQLVTGGFNRPFRSENNANAWICTDPKVVEAYDADPKCGFPFTLNGYYSLLNLVTNVYSKKNWKLANASLPIHFISGGDDPCRIDDKHFYQAVNTMKAVGYQNVTARLYPGMRHELLNEPVQKDVMADMLCIMDRICKA